MKSYDEWPEAIRWILFLPAVALAFLAFALFLRLGQWWRGEEGLLIDVGTTVFMAWAFFPMVFALAPRGQKIAGWCFYVLMVLYMGVAFFVGGIRGLGIAGLLPMLPPPEWATWSKRDTIELLQSLTWLIVGTVSFRHARKKFAKEHPEPAKAPPEPSGEPQYFYPEGQKFDPDVLIRTTFETTATTDDRKNLAALVALLARETYSGPNCVEIEAMRLCLVARHSSPDGETARQRIATARTTHAAS